VVAAILKWSAITVGELPEPPLQLGPLATQARVVAQHVVSVPEGAVEAAEQVTVVASEVDDLFPELGELLLLPHARPPRRLPVGDGPPPPPLLREQLPPTLERWLAVTSFFSLVVGAGRMMMIKQWLVGVLEARG